MNNNTNHNHPDFYQLGKDSFQKLSARRGRWLANKEVEFLYEWDWLNSPGYDVVDPSGFVLGSDGFYGVPDLYYVMAREAGSGRAWCFAPHLKGLVFKVKDLPGLWTLDQVDGPRGSLVWGLRRPGAEEGCNPHLCCERFDEYQDMESYV